jgi:hypothetical protein
MILTGKTEVLGEKRYTTLVVEGAIRSTTLTLTEGGLRKFGILNVPRQCPLALLV